MKKILPTEQPAPVQPMNPANIIRDLMQNNGALQHMLLQQQNISVILAVELFKATKAIETNVLVAPGHPNLSVVGPLTKAVRQSDINAIEHLFGTEGPPTLQFIQEQIGDDVILIAKLVPLSEAEANARVALN